MRSRVGATQLLLHARRTSPHGKPACSHARDSTMSHSSPTHQQVVGSCVIVSSQALPAGCPAGAQRHIPPHSLQLRLQPALCTLAQQAAAARVLHAGWLGEQAVGWGRANIGSGLWGACCRFEGSPTPAGIQPGWVTAQQARAPEPQPRRQEHRNHSPAPGSPRRLAARSADRTGCG